MNACIARYPAEEPRTYVAPLRRRQGTARVLAAGAARALHRCRLQTRVARAAGGHGSSAGLPHLRRRERISVARRRRQRDQAQSSRSAAGSRPRSRPRPRRSALPRRSGSTPGVFVDVLAAGGSAHRTRWPRPTAMLEGTSARVRLRHAFKDVQLALAAAEREVELPPTCSRNADGRRSPTAMLTRTSPPCRRGAERSSRKSRELGTRRYLASLG